MRMLFALPGLHKYDRGAEVAFISIARELAKAGEDVTLIGSGEARANEPYRFLHAGSIRRERFAHFPSMPVLRNDTSWEELTFVFGLLRQYRPADYDVTLTCSYPFTNWILRRQAPGGRPPHVFVTQNGDWPARSTNSEYRYFGCEGLVCTNPDFYERNRTHWRCALIPNGVDCGHFRPGPGARQRFGIPSGGIVVLMVSALIPSKRVTLGLEAVSELADAHLVVAGSGPLRADIEAAAARLLPGRMTLLTVPAADMPLLYQSADIFLHLSKEESFGNVFVEALASGLPVVAPDTARVRWIVGDDQFLVASDDAAAIGDAIIAASNAPTAKRHDRVTKAASFSWIKIGQSYQEFLHAVVSGQKARTFHKA